MTRTEKSSTFYSGYMSRFAGHHVVDFEPGLLAGENDAGAIGRDGRPMDWESLEGDRLDHRIVDAVDLMQPQSLVQTGSHQNLKG